MKEKIKNSDETGLKRVTIPYIKGEAVRWVGVISCLLACMSAPWVVYADDSGTSSKSGDSGTSSKSDDSGTSSKSDDSGTSSKSDDSGTSSNSDHSREHNTPSTPSRDSTGAAVNERIYVVTGCQDVKPANAAATTVTAYCQQIPTPRECYRTRLETQLTNALYCSTLKKSHGEKEDEEDDRDDKDSSHAKKGEIEHEEEDDKEKVDKRCGAAPLLDADRDGDGKDGNEDDNKHHDDDGSHDKGDGKKTIAKADDCNPNDVTDLSCKAANKYKDDDLREEHGDNEDCDDDHVCTKYQGKTKVTICHVPPGNPQNAHTITVSQNALRHGHMNKEDNESEDEHERHKLHGDDYFGACSKTVAVTKDITPVLKPILVPKSKLPYVIKEYRDCLDPKVGGGSKSVLAPSSSGNGGNAAGKGGRLNWREIVK